MKRRSCILFILLALIYLLPVVVTVTNSFMESGEIRQNYGQYIDINLVPARATLSQYGELLFDSPVYLHMFWNSVKIVLPVVIGQVLVSVLAAYAFTVLKFRGREILFFLYIIVMLLPLQVTLVPNYMVADWFDITDSYLAIILPGIFEPFGVFLMRQYMKSIPEVYIEAARIDGAGHGRIFLSIIAPMVKPGITATAMLTMMEYWNLVDQAVIFIQDPEAQPLSTFLAQIGSSEPGLAFAGSCFYAIPVMFVLFCGQDYLKSGISIAGLKG